MTDTKRALLDPTDVFRTPQEVLDVQGLGSPSIEQDPQKSIT